MNQSQSTLTSDYNIIMHLINIVGTRYNVLLDTIVDDLTWGARYHLAQGMLTVSWFFSSH